ncbi:MAG TPA: insulinase family protein [Gemmatimonadaceae bacterium]|nr:insulinase family protein [Gemmatimonadaceae bacterium]
MLRSALLLGLVSAAALAQPPSLSAPLPADSAVLTGRLPNGLRYFIRRNAKPEKRAELRLVVNAGSILESDAQRGIAHFVEHMAFDGTRRFPKADIVNFLERVGMRFGADLNAYTSFDETVYMLQIPTDTARVVTSALDILEDWAQGVMFDPAEIRKERNVVIEEWRTGRSASTRVSYRQIPVMLRGSDYALRVPIGTKENLETFPDSLAIRFYRDWYRPDLMSVIAVGDFDAKRMEMMIRERFARIPMPAAPRPRTLAAVPDHAETLVSIETDKEYPSKQVALLWKKPHEETRTVGDFRRELVAAFYDGMMNQRFQELTQKPDAPFAFAGSGRGEIVRTKDGYQLVAGVKESGFVEAAQALLAEAERVRRFGFTVTELDRQKVNYVRNLDQRLAERDKMESEGFASSYVSAALSGEPTVSIAQEVALGKQFSPTIVLDEVNAIARTTFTDQNRVVLVAAPEQPEVKVPDAAAMLAVFESARTQPLTAFVDSTSNEPLVTALPTPGRITSERTLPETGILEWKLSNGARILLKPTDFKADEVLLQAQSPGGMSLLDDRDLTTALGSSIIQSVSGVGSFSRIALSKKLTGKKANAGAGLEANQAGVYGQASRKDIETLFQLVWLRFTQPRVDSAAYRAFANQMKAAMSNQRNQPSSVFGDTITLTMAQHHPRVRIFGPELLDSVDLGRALQIFKERFANAGGFTFFLVGSFAPDSVRPLVERYIASLPSGGRKETVVDRGVRPPPGVVARTVRKGIEPKASTRLYFSSPCAYSFEHRVVLEGLRELLDIRLREVLREDKGGTYGVAVSASCNHIPYQRAAVQISFGSAPERVDELTTAVFAVIDSIKAGVVSDSNMTKVREIALRAHETALKENEAWLGAMADADEDGRDQRDFLRTADLVKHLTREQLRNAARAHLNTQQYARFTLLPERATTPAVKP